MTESEYNALYNRTNLTDADYVTLDKLRKQKVRLMDQIKNESTWEKKDTPAGFGINFAKGQTRESSWTGQTDMTKNKMATLASMFEGGIRVTSGFRTNERGDAAMLNSTSDFRKTYSKETLKGIKDIGAPNSEERKAAITQMRMNGFQSQHEHGNALDFSYPTGYSKTTFPQLKNDILSVFPGANLIQEKDHLHMSFSDKALPNQSAIALMNPPFSSPRNEQGQRLGENTMDVSFGDGTSKTYVISSDSSVSNSESNMISSGGRAQPLRDSYSNKTSLN
jgi:hypothetical protein